MNNENILLYARQGFLKELLFNNIANARQVLSLKKQLNIKINFNTVLVLTIDNYYSLTFNKSEMKKQQMRINTLQTLEKIASEMEMYTLNISEESFAILLRTEQSSILDFRKSQKIAQIIINKVKQTTGITVSIGIGRPYTDIQNIHLSYKEALLACSGKFFSGGGQVIHISQVLPFQEDLGIFPEEVESELTISLLGCNIESACNVLNDYLAKCHKIENLNPLLLKTRLIEIITLMIKLAQETGANPKRLSEISGEYIKLLMQADTIHVLSGIISKSANEIIKEIFITRKRKNLTSFECSVKYILENYHRQLTQEEVANHVYLNVYYFSHGFKSFTGVSFIDYLTRVRIEEAKKILLAGNTNISNVAKKVGYLNTNYFGRVFKNIVGVPPSKYRPELSD